MAVLLGVLVAGLVMIFDDSEWLDPLVHLVIATVILVGTWHLLRESMHLALDDVLPPQRFGSTWARHNTLAAFTVGEVGSPDQ